MPAKGQDMTTSIFLARLIGPVFVLVGIGMFANRAAYQAMAHEIVASAPLIYISGVLAFVAGLAIVLNHNVWAADWRIIITLIGWLALLRGAMRVVFPQQSVALI